MGNDILEREGYLFQKIQAGECSIEEQSKETVCDQWSRNSKEKAACMDPPGNELPEALFLQGWDLKKGTFEISVDTYYIGKYEVTAKQYEDCVLQGWCPPTRGDCYSIRYIGYPKRSSIDNMPAFWNEPKRDKCPMICVSWAAARSYCRWLGGDLPTENQWEYAARCSGMSKDTTDNKGGESEGKCYESNISQTVKEEIEDSKIYNMNDSVSEWNREQVWMRWSDNPTKIQYFTTNREECLKKYPEECPEQKVKYYLPGICQEADEHVPDNLFRGGSSELPGYARYPGWRWAGPPFPTPIIGMRCVIELKSSSDDGGAMGSIPAT
ncbi:MAG: SUMF1/EgtB/PvdO family nonheme iron enzyme [Deltaproteobacteria bacterium]|nr:SUMF1/EgtB/PvdO family nonheme iron enzyme [Deltaproteobacteria bacterium]